MRQSELYKLDNILTHCLIISDTVQEFGNSLDSFLSNKIYQYSVSYSLMKIGVIINKLSKNDNIFSQQITFNKFKELGDKIEHEYLSIDFSEIWNAVANDLLELKKFCDDMLNNKEDLVLNNLSN
jgi:uncharacterized protein with HEPN domain